MCVCVARQRYELTLVAADAGIPRLSTSLQVLIIVDDVNDNGPVFDWASYNVSLSLTSAAVNNTFITRVSARDADAGVNALLTYHFAARTQVSQLHSSSAYQYMYSVA